MAGGNGQSHTIAYTRMFSSLFVPCWQPMSVAFLFGSWTAMKDKKKQFSLPFSLLLSFFHARGRACARAHTHSADVASQYFAVWQRGISSTIVIKFRYFLFTPVSPKVLTCSSVCSNFFLFCRSPRLSRG